MNPAIMAEPMKMLFRLWIRVGPGNSGWGPDPPWEGAILGKGSL